METRAPLGGWLGAIARDRASSRTPQPAHLVQFYRDDERLCRVVCDFLEAGLAADEPVLVIATEAHRDLFERELLSRQAPVERARNDGRFVWLDARETLDRLLVDGLPDWGRFEEEVGSRLAALTSPGKSVRAYGEMVDLLWRQGERMAAIRLEEMWKELVKQYDFSLLCSYVMGNFYRDGDTGQFAHICGMHTHVLPAEEYDDDAPPLERALQVAKLQQRVGALEVELADRKQLEQALRQAMEERLRNEAFAKQVIGIVSHDLRNPLHAIVMSSAVAQGRVTDEKALRALVRISASAERAARIISDLLDLTHDWQTGRIPIRTEQMDLRELLLETLDEQRSGNADRTIELDMPESCHGEWDRDRIGQVIANLVSNALRHSESPVLVRAAQSGSEIVLTVHNDGPPIENELRPHLFKPFTSGAGKHMLKSLGLGLYIVERIVSAHGGRVECESTHVGGTTFRVTLPCKNLPPDEPSEVLS